VMSLELPLNVAPCTAGAAIAQTPSNAAIELKRCLFTSHPQKRKT
jgi:hypothetical protein